jgi:hypothetical protein
MERVALLTRAVASVPYDWPGTVLRYSVGFLIAPSSPLRRISMQSPAHKEVDCEIRSQDLENPPPRC